MIDICFVVFMQVKGPENRAFQKELSASSWIRLFPWLSLLSRAAAIRLLGCIFPILLQSDGSVIGDRPIYQQKC